MKRTLRRCAPAV